jgi:hypothetical protein
VVYICGYLCKALFIHLEVYWLLTATQTYSSYATKNICSKWLVCVSSVVLMANKIYIATC